MAKRFRHGAAAWLLIVGLAACKQAPAQDLTRPDPTPGPKVYFVNIVDGQTVKSPFKVVFGLKDWGVAPAGVDVPNTGHHHLLIDTTLSQEDMQYAIAKDDHHRHFGGGQTEAVLDLAPGPHTLQLVLGDKDHEPFDPPIMSQIVTVTVQ
ncbi:MAG: DUF4399 domain-containing protein [Alphaproteobacteria bacterium]|nr:MAG: DUF4399 domain-containing protein [Alphaproteobacteria bacterium]